MSEKLGGGDDRVVQLPGTQRGHKTPELSLEDITQVQTAWMYTKAQLIWGPISIPLTLVALTIVGIPGVTIGKTSWDFYTEVLTQRVHTIVNNLDEPSQLLLSEVGVDGSTENPDCIRDFQMIESTVGTEISVGCLDRDTYRTQWGDMQSVEGFDIDTLSGTVMEIEKYESSALGLVIPYRVKDIMNYDVVTQSIDIDSSVAFGRSKDFTLSADTLPSDEAIDEVGNTLSQTLQEFGNIDIRLTGFASPEGTSPYDLTSYSGESYYKNLDLAQQRGEYVFERLVANFPELEPELEAVASQVGVLTATELGDLGRLFQTYYPTLTLYSEFDLDKAIKQMESTEISNEDQAKISELLFRGVKADYSYNVVSDTSKTHKDLDLRGIMSAVISMMTLLMAYMALHIPEVFGRMQMGRVLKKQGLTTEKGKIAAAFIQQHYGQDHLDTMLQEKRIREL